MSAKLTTGEYFTIGYVTEDLILHNKVGYVVYCTMGDDDDLLPKIAKNAEYYENLPPMELENLGVLIRENKARQALYELYKSFNDSIDLEAETLEQIDTQLKALQLKLTMMEALYSLNKVEARAWNGLRW